MYQECQTYRHPGMKDSFFVPKVKAGECHKDNWNRLSTQIVYEQNPPASFEETMQCINSYQRSNQCDVNHWAEIANTCGTGKHSFFPQPGDVMMNEGSHQKVIKANGDFYVDDKLLGRGSWVTATRFVVLSKIGEVFGGLES